MQTHTGGIRENLAYRVQRFLTGRERGIVLQAEKNPEENKLELRYYVKDDFGQLPQKVRFQDPLGEVRTGLSSMIGREIMKYERQKLKAYEYKRYQHGDSFP